jgi:hypothetical protein
MLFFYTNKVLLPDSMKKRYREHPYFGANIGNKKGSPWERGETQ